MHLDAVAQPALGPDKLCSDDARPGKPKPCAQGRSDLGRRSREPDPQQGQARGGLEALRELQPLRRAPCQSKGNLDVDWEEGTGWLRLDTVVASTRRTRGGPLS